MIRSKATTIGGLQRRTYYVVDRLDTAEPVHRTEPLLSVDASNERRQGAIA